MRTVAGRLVRELLRVLPAESGFRPRLDLCLKFVNGEKVDGHKIYSLHETDGHTIDEAMEQVGRVYGRRLRILAGDRGYRGQETSGDTQVVISDVPNASDSAYAKEKKHRLFRKRARSSGTARATTSWEATSTRVSSETSSTSCSQQRLSTSRGS